MSKTLFKVALVVLFGFVANTASAQSNSFDNRLLSKFSPEEIQSMDESVLAYWNYAVDKGYVIRKKTKTDSDMGNISLDDWQKENFNFLEYKLEPSEQNKAFIIEGTDMFLLVFSEEKIKNLMKLQ